MVTAVAHPNIALIKYWGKQPGEDNQPATPSLSITVGDLTSRTTVEEASAGCGAQLQLNGERRDDPKVEQWLAKLSARFDLPPLVIDSSNNFPTGAGLASSASGFAALITAIDALCALELSEADRSAWARLGSASAARSLAGGFATLEGPAWTVRRLCPRDAWPLRVIVAITSSERKAVSSSDGMRRSAATSAFYDAWVAQTPRDFEVAEQAVLTRDFAALAAVAQASCLQMHSLMLSTRPPLVYWNAATMACIQRVLALQSEGVATFFTIDAGPQVKAVCLPSAADQVRDALAAIDGVQDVLDAPLGDAPVLEG